MCLCEDNQFWFKFGRDGVDYRGKSEPKMMVGNEKDQMNDLEYADRNNVYEKKDVYTKAEIDEIIENLPGGGGDMSDYVRKDEILVNYSVDFDYELGIGGLDDSITIYPYLIERIGGE